MPEITAQTCTSESLFEENADLLERILCIRETAEAATSLEALKVAVLSECLRATDYEQWLAQQ